MFQDLNKGQHFLVNKEILKKEIEIANLSEKDSVIEIGGGEGILTNELVKKAGKVLCFEIDKRFQKTLDKIKNENKNLEITYDNALKYSWEKYNKIVSNIPYNLSEQTIMKSIEDNISSLTLIVGENFKEILSSRETKIGFASNLFFNIKFITEVKKEDFSPPPRVDSWLIHLDKKEKFNPHEKILQKILTKKGKIKNAIIYSLVEEGKTKNQSKEILEKMKIPENILNKPVKKITGKFLLNFEKEL